jgi:hypothetical protein
VGLSRLPGLTVGQLRRQLAGLPDGLAIVVQDVSSESDRLNFAGGILSVRVVPGDFDNMEFVMIDCSSDDVGFVEEGTGGS